MGRIRITALVALIWLVLSSTVYAVTGQGVWIAFPNGTTCPNYNTAPINDQTLCYDSVTGWQVFHGSAWVQPNLAGVLCSQLPALSGVITTSAGSCVTTSNTAIVTVTIQKFTASGTYTPHAGIQFAVVECIGGGGAGGGTVGTSGHVDAGSGGGAGSYSRVRLTAAQIGGSQVITIGAGGLAGSAGNNPGGNGGDTSLGSLCIGKGGSGGPGTPDLTQAAGGAGGVAGTGDITIVGNDGQQSINFNGITLVPPFPSGGPGFFGGQSNHNSVTGAGCFTSGTANSFGSGGGGALCYNQTTNGAGAAGAPGIVIVTEYNNQ